MIALVSSAAGRSSDSDLPLLTAALGQLGCPSTVVEWDDPAIEWADFDTAVIRSTWDYVGRVDEFVAWCRDASGRTRLWNPADVVEWNIDKRYLVDLEAAGIPVVKTVFVRPGADIPVGVSGRIVIKPAIGADAGGAATFDEAPDAAADHLTALLRAGFTAMVQPYETGIDAAGETGLVYMDREFSHAFSKPALLDGAPAARDEHGIMTYSDRSIRPTTPTREELVLGQRTMEYLHDRFGPTAYARIDLVPVGGAPVVLELELIEPSLFLDTEPDAANRAARHFAQLANA